jgi:hypothetical protein
MKTLFRWDLQPTQPAWAVGLTIAEAPDGWVYAADDNDEQWLPLFAVEEIPQVKAMKARIADLEKKLMNAACNGPSSLYE